MQDTRPRLLRNPHVQMPAPELLDRVREEVWLRGLSRSTAVSYTRWVRRYVLFHGTRHSREMGAEEVQRFLVHLATERDVAASTQNQALAALLFPYRHVLDRQLDTLGARAAAKRTARLPTVFMRAEARAALGELKGRPHLLASLLYGAGLRLLGCLRLRINDIDFDRRRFIVRDGKGATKRRVMLPSR